MPTITECRQMIRHFISDWHEWINEIPTVPIYYLAKPSEAKGTGLEELAGKQDHIEFDSYLAL